MEPPDVVFLPSLRVAPGDEQAQLVLRRLPDDALVLPAYTSLDELVRCCGDEQPWVAFPPDAVDRLAAELGVSSVVVDTPFEDA